MSGSTERAPRTIHLRSRPGGADSSPPGLDRGRCPMPRIRCRRQRDFFCAVAERTPQDITPYQGLTARNPPSHLDETRLATARSRARDPARMTQPQPSQPSVAHRGYAGPRPSTTEQAATDKHAPEINTIDHWRQTRHRTKEVEHTATLRERHPGRQQRSDDRPRVVRRSTASSHRAWRPRAGGDGRPAAQHTAGPSVSSCWPHRCGGPAARSGLGVPPARHTETS